MEEDYAQYTLEELKDICRDCGIRAVGKRETLIRKLAEHRAQNAERARQEAARFKVYVRTMSGKVSTIYCSADMDFADFLVAVGEETGIEPAKMILYSICSDPPCIGDMTIGDPLGGQNTAKRLRAGTLAANGVLNGSTVLLHLVLR